MNYYRFSPHKHCMIDKSKYLMKFYKNVELFRRQVLLLLLLFMLLFMLLMLFATVTALLIGRQGGLCQPLTNHNAQAVAR